MENDLVQTEKALILKSANMVRGDKLAIKGSLLALVLFEPSRFPIKGVVVQF